MSTNIIFAKPNETIKDVSIKLLEHKISGLPILDDDGKLLGIISQTDIVKLSEKYKKEELEKLKVEEFIKNRRKKLIVAKLNTPLKRLIKLMVKHNISRIPIIDKDKKVIGIVSKHDILKMFLTKEEEIEEGDRILTLIDKILKILDEKKMVNISDLAKELNESEENLEKNLKILEKYGFVELSYSLGKIVVKKKWKH